MISPLLTCGCSTRRWHSKALQNTTTWWWRVFHRTPCHVHNNIKPRGTLQSRLRRTLYEPAQGLFTGLSVWLCSRSRMNLRKACSQVCQSGSVLGPVWTCARLVHRSLSLALFSVLLCYLITMCPQLQHRCCFVADQLWLMTCIREEEEDYVPTITAQSQSECQLSAASRLISRLHSRLDPTIIVLYRMCKTDLMHWVMHTTLFTYLNTVNWMFISVVCTV